MFKFKTPLLLMASWLLFTNPLLASPNELQAVGTSQVKAFFARIYEATLKTPDGRYQENRYPLALEIRYQRYIAKEMLLNVTDQQWRHLGVPTAERQQWLTQLQKLWPNAVQAGDTLTLYVDSKKGNRFYYNGKPLGGVNHARFGEQFLAIWLSPKTSRPDIRQQLITPRKPT